MEKSAATSGSEDYPKLYECIDSVEDEIKRLIKQLEEDLAYAEERADLDDAAEFDRKLQLMRAALKSNEETYFSADEAFR